MTSKYEVMLPKALRAIEASTGTERLGKLSADSAANEELRGGALSPQCASSTHPNAVATPELSPSSSPFAEPPASATARGVPSVPTPTDVVISAEIDCHTDASPRAGENSSAINSGESGPRSSSRGEGDRGAVAPSYDAATAMRGGGLVRKRLAVGEACASSRVRRLGVVGDAGAGPSTDGREGSGVYAAMAQPWAQRASIEAC